MREQLHQRYAGRFATEALSYATVQDYCDSFDHLRALTTAANDIRDVQRPWMVKAILGRVPRGGQLLEIAYGESSVAEMLRQLGYSVMVTRGVAGIAAQTLDCVYSISVLQHLAAEDLVNLAQGSRTALKPAGVSIHAAGHIHRGRGEAESLRTMEFIVETLGLSRAELASRLQAVDQDPETYFLSAESHNGWRGALPYDQFPMRPYIGMQFVSEPAAIRADLPSAAPVSGAFAWAEGLSETEWLEFLTGTRLIAGRRAPDLPAGEVQRNFVGAEGMAAFQEAAQFLHRVRSVIYGYGGPLLPRAKVLDFGVGWGRLYCILQREIDAGNLVGVDVDGKAIEMCKRAMPSGIFLQIPPSPPYDFPGGHFDLILLYSVFSHLSEEAFRAVITEFGRILKPGGSVAFTTLKKAHLNVWADRVDLPSWRPHFARANFDFAAWQTKLDAGEFLFVPTGGGDPSRPAEFYGEAIVSEAFLRRMLPGTPFHLAHFSEPGDAPQAFVVLRRE